MFGWYECTPGLSFAIPICHGHTGKDVASEHQVPVECSLCAPRDLIPQDSIDVRIPMNAHSHLSWKEIRSSPEALKAVCAEVETLAEIGFWDHANFCERDALIAWANDTNTKTFAGEGLTTNKKMVEASVALRILRYLLQTAGVNIKAAFVTGFHLLRTKAVR